MIRHATTHPIAATSPSHRWSRGVVLLAAGLALGACSTWQVHVSDTSVAASAAHHTFAFGAVESPPSGYQPTTQAAVALNQLETATTQCLTARGYQPVAAGHADLIVRFAVGVRVDTRISASPGGTSAGDSTLRTETEGDWTLDVFDAASGQRVWRGRAHGDVDPGSASTTSMLHAVERILVAFPRAGA